MARIRIGLLKIDKDLYDFVGEEVLPGTGLTANAFWSGADDLFHDVGPQIRAALAKRAELNAAIDAYHRDRAAGQIDPEEYEGFLRSIEYLVDEPAEVSVTTDQVDPEIATIAGPQLVVPLLNARFAINAANARWGSLYDALYGTDVISDDEGRERTATYNPVRGAEVVARGRAFLDRHLGLANGSHADVRGYAVDAEGLAVSLNDGSTTRLADAGQFVGFQGSAFEPTAVLLVHHGLHVEIQIDRANPVGTVDAAGIKDIVLEAAVTTIMDLEDSVAAVETSDKVLGYRNWLHLMRGRMDEKVTKDGVTFLRSLNPDRIYRDLNGGKRVLPGRALLLIRHVGHLMTTDAVLDDNGQPVSEGALDALVTGLASLHDIRGTGDVRNSRTGSMYVVKPKLHGRDEVALAVEVLARVEMILGLPDSTIKIGIMDEERRTSVNLKACIAAASSRLAFINTGFLDRTGDEIHTSMHAGPMVRKADMKTQTWLQAYEDANVDIGLECGLQGRAQIGKGMWATPDNMADMLAQKAAHPSSGANCAWVPSPTAATLHTTHYHEVDVTERQRELRRRPRRTLAELLTIPIGESTRWSDGERRVELDNNVQSTLGYVVRWINAGIGCSKVPDIHGTALMEDRATCRISSQHVANWVRHGVITIDEVEDSLHRMAVKVDEQNADDPSYQPMAPSFDGQAFLAATALLLEGAAQPSGYTEPILHKHRILQKALMEGGNA